MNSDEIICAVNGLKYWIGMFNPNAENEMEAKDLAQPIVFNYLDMMDKGIAQEDALFATVISVNYYALATLPYKGDRTAKELYRTMDEAINGTDRRAPTKTLADYMSQTSPNGKPKRDTEFDLDMIKVEIWKEMQEDEPDEEVLEALGVEYLEAFRRHGYRTNSNRIPILRLVGTDMVPKDPADPDGEKVPYYQTVGDAIVEGRLSLESYMAMQASNVGEIVAGIMVRLDMNGNDYFAEGVEIPGYDMEETCAERLMSLGAEAWTLPLIAIADYAREGTEYLGETDVSNMYRRLFNRNANGRPWDGSPRYELRANLILLNRIMTGISYKYKETEVMEMFEACFDLVHVSNMTVETVGYYA
jgi:hypothetical protein